MVAEGAEGPEGAAQLRGEVVYDSILLNKQKTKSYWEQLMMAAAVPASPPSAAPGVVACSPQVAAVSPQSPQGRADMPSLEQAGSEVSEQEFYDARSSVSPSEPAEPLVGEGCEGGDLPDGGLGGPKVVETVAKACRRLQGLQQGLQGLTPARDGESVVERDIRLQREREEQLAREREAAFSLDLLRDDGFVSIPTDEGNCSEYGSEEKEHSIDGTNSRVMSPDVGVLPHHHHHQRTQSMDSTSSGHSSGSGSGSSAFNGPNAVTATATPTATAAATNGLNGHGPAGRRRVTVKPLADPEDADTTPLPAFHRTANETPIEREIRLAREREAELAREKALRLGLTPATPIAQEQTTVIVNGTSNKNNAVSAVINNNGVEVVETRESVRNATNRIQQEISRANEREQELRHCKEGPQRFATPEFPDRVKLKKAVSTSQLAVIASSEVQPQPASTPCAPPQPPVTATTTPVARPPLWRLVSSTASSTPASRATLGRSVSASPVTSPVTPPAMPLTLGAGGLRRFAPNPSQKGLMQRFLASRGKMSPAVASSGVGSVPSHPPVQPLAHSTPSPAPLSPAQVHVPLSASVTAKVAAMVDARDEREEPAPAPVRRGYTSAEDKIQEELKEMRRREEELRLQRARTFARSQPNLLSLLDDVDSTDSTTPNESSPVIDKLPAMAALRSALSNPNLLDEEAHHNGVDSLNEKNSQKSVGIRKKNALIAEWENRIQQHIEH